jgi:hypothetical protein
VSDVTLQIVRDWVPKLNSSGSNALIDYKGPGPQPIQTDAHRAAPAQAIEDGPMPAIHGVVRWRVIDLVQAHDPSALAQEVLGALVPVGGTVRSRRLHFALSARTGMAAIPCCCGSQRRLL